PGMDGLEVCRRIRRNEETEEIPIVMLTAKTEDVDIITGLEIGADDYVTKPFSPKVLVARIRAVLRRKEEKDKSPKLIRFDGLEIHLGRHEVRIDGNSITLTLTEFRILQLLASRPGWVYSREQIVSHVRGTGYPVTERAVDVQIVGLRKKLGKFGDRIVTVRGIGYKLADDS
ncbi:MAG: response regulator transcription factor, partial [Deltaproteobacteria bacterium]|nr:response regulator transcription factor [Deltaproteobacteria bacterium]